MICNCTMFSSFSRCSSVVRPGCSGEVIMRNRASCTGFPFRLMGALTLLAACSAGHAAAGDRRHAARNQNAATPMPAKTVANVARHDPPLPPAKPCRSDNLHRSLCMIDLISKDIGAHYGWPSGGGITAITALSSTSYAVVLPQEERIDVLTYTFAVEANGVRMTQRTASTRSLPKP